MALDLTQFHEAFFAESFEALDSMEAALLKLDVGAPDPELINTIFRVAHSIKGGSATFGFTEIASFTHSLETLLDELRGHRMAVTAAISNLLLKSVDVMREMLRAVQARQPIDAQRVADMQFDLELVIAQKNGAAGGESTAGCCVICLAYLVSSVSSVLRARQRSAAHAPRARDTRRSGCPCRRFFAPAADGARSASMSHWLGRAARRARRRAGDQGGIRLGHRGLRSADRALRCSR